MKSENKQELIVITGPRGVGKSFAVFGYPRSKENYELTFAQDSENSANNILGALKENGVNLGHYTNLGERFANLPSDADLLSRISAGKFPWIDGRGRNGLLEYWEYILDDINTNLEPGKYKYYIHDTLEKMEAGMAAWVEANSRKSGVSSTAYGRMWTDGVFPLYDQFLNAIFARGVETILLTSHLKTPWVDKRPIVGKVIPSGKKILFAQSRLYLWLTNDPENKSGAPAALVLKERFGKLVFKDGYMLPQRMLPRRIPNFTWKKFDDYLVNGADLENPAPGEELSPEEVDMISDVPTDAQMQLMLADLKRETQEQRTRAAEIVASANAPVEQALSSDTIAEIRKRKELGESVTDIATAMKISIPKVLAA